MKVIYKYRMADKVEMPKNSAILSVAMQHDKLTLWALVETEEPLIHRLFFVAGTGSSQLLSADSKTFIATVQDPPFVWHIFDLGEVE